MTRSVELGNLDRDDPRHRMPDSIHRISGSKAVSCGASGRSSGRASQEKRTPGLSPKLIGGVTVGGGVHPA